MHSDDPAVAHVPAVQFTHKFTDMAPETVVDCPEAHVTQVVADVDATEEDQEPSTQLMHRLAAEAPFVVDHEPVAQLIHTSAVAAPAMDDHLPIGQL